MIKLYNQHTGKIEMVASIEIGGANVYLHKLTEAHRNALGYFKIAYTSPADRRYYTSVADARVINGTYTIGYINTERNVEEVKAKMTKDLFEVADKYEDEATIDTDLGFKVHGNPKALQAFTLGSKRGTKEVRDSNYQKHTVSVPEMAKILQDVEDNAIVLFETKGDKFDEIQALQTVAECILYEATPYEVTEDIVDELGEPTGETQVVTRHKNNVREW